MKMMSWSRYRLRSLLRAARRYRDTKASKGLIRGEREGRYATLPQHAPVSAGPGYTRSR